MPLRNAMRLALLAILLPAQAMAQAPAACGEATCRSGVNFTVPGGYAWKPGRYVFQFALDQAKTVACVGELPLKPCDQGPAFHCDSKQIAIGEAGCEMKGAGRVTEIALGGAPRKIVLRVVRDGETVLTRTLSPDYAVSEPNGPTCPPACRNAVYSLFNLR